MTDTAARPDEVAPVGGRDRLMLTLGAFAAMGVFAIGINVLGPALDIIAEVFSLPLAQAGLLPSMMMVGILIGVAAGGVLSDFAGARVVAMLAMGALATGAILIATTSYFPLALVAMAIIGAGGGLTMGFANPLVAALWPRRAASMLNVLNAAYPGCAIAVSLGTGIWIQRGMNWRVLYVIAGAAAAATFLSFAARRVTVRSGDGITLAQLPSLLRSTLIAHLGLMMILSMGAEAGVGSWLCMYAVRELDFSTALAGSALSLYWAGMLVGRLALGFLSHHMRLSALIIICGAGASLSWLGVITATAPAVIMPALFVAGAFHSGGFPLILAYARPRYQDVFGSASGLLIAIGTIGSMLVPYFIGFAGESVGLRVSVGGIAALELGVALLACVLYVRASRDRTDAPQGVSSNGN